MGAGVAKINDELSCGVPIRCLVVTIIFLWVTFLSTLALGQTVTLSLAPGRGKPGGTVVLPIKLTSADGAHATGIQWSLVYPSAITGVTLSLGNAGVMAHKSLACNGNLCFVAGLNSTIIPDGNVAIATFHIAPNQSAESIPIQVTDVVAASAAADSIPVRSVSGTVSLLNISWVRRFLECRPWSTLASIGPVNRVRTGDF